MAAPRPLSLHEYDSFFSDNPGQYPGYLGHSTLALSPANEQPPTVLQRGPLDPTVQVTAAQADHFVRHGFVIIEGLIAEDQLERWRRQFWDVVGADPHNSTGWPGSKFDGTVWDQNRAGPCVNALNPPVGHHPRVRAVVAQLGGPNMAEGQRPKMPARPQEPIDHAVVHFAAATDKRDWSLPPAPPTGGHIDGANPPKGIPTTTAGATHRCNYLSCPDNHVLCVMEHYRGPVGRPSLSNVLLADLSVVCACTLHAIGGWVGGCAIVASTYLFDVTAKGGGTCFFPGSHAAVGQIFEQEPDQFRTGDFARSFGYGADHAHDLFRYGGDGDHIIATMKAGSVCFAHGYLVHTTTPNLNPDTIRLGASQWKITFKHPRCQSSASESKSCTVWPSSLHFCLCVRFVYRGVLAMAFCGYGCQASRCTTRHVEVLGR